MELDTLYKKLENYPWWPSAILYGVLLSLVGKTEANRRKYGQFTGQQWLQVLKSKEAWLHLNVLSSYDAAHAIHSKF